ncbi:MAG TPA: type II toxin-antitoxin system PemK/MazF family toxin [Sphingomonadaceae bacterium]
MKRGSVVIAAERGSFAGKPCPWLVVQNSDLLDDPVSITVCAISSDAVEASFRVAVAPTPANGLDRPSLVLIDKITTLRRESIDQVAGEIDTAIMRRVDAEIRFWLDL